MKHLMLAVLISGAMLAFAAAAQQTTPVKRPTIRQRQINQQKRIGEGVDNGQLTPRESVNLERKESRLNREIRRDRNDGNGLNSAERRKINRQQNRLSRQIYREKHDRQAVPPKQ